MQSLNTAVTAIAHAGLAWSIGTAADQIFPYVEAEMPKRMNKTTAVQLLEVIAQFGLSFALLSESMSLLLPRAATSPIGDGTGVLFLVLSQPCMLTKLRAVTSSVVGGTERVVEGAFDYSPARAHRQRDPVVGEGHAQAGAY
jgi:hypothetical protein